MTFKILESISLPESYKKMPGFSDKYYLLGFFYEHKKNTAGLDFEKEPLEKYTDKSKKDPADVEGSGLKDWSLSFSEIINNIIAIRIEGKAHNSIIFANYNLYEVYYKR